MQGVGFRPAVHRIAADLALTGFVFNDSRGVTIELQGNPTAINQFLTRLTGPDRPPASDLKEIQTLEIATVINESCFTIQPSETLGSPTSQVTPDLAVCSDCLREMNDKTDFRYRYPFINCTNCGPRYSIVKAIPYDRPNTTMSQFAMCPQCSAQYTDVTNRRFHAQPVACPADGPKIWLTNPAGKTICSGTEQTIEKAASLLRNGHIVAIKGIGGFHLAVDAYNNDAVVRLRQRKHRDHKPFAMMAASIETIKKHALVDSQAEILLKSAAAPIVILPQNPDHTIAPNVAQQVNSFGFMLCYAPLHFLLFEQRPEVLVMTSANISDEPLICDNGKTLERLGDVADAFLMHDRQIYRQLDDSIIHFIDEQPVMLRRARGYVPTPVFLNENCPDDILATGADMKNTFCFVKDDFALCSEHIGDLEDATVYHHYTASIDHLAALYEHKPAIIAHDLHPGYFSTQYALTKNIRAIGIQHHWAHIASVLAEHNYDGSVIGIECDGTGFGTDGNIWGCEVMIANLEKFDRFAHLDYYTLPGGDKASKEAIRPLMALLKKAFGDGFEISKFAWLMNRIEPDVQKQQIILAQIEKGINTVQTSSLGRVFDAVAAAVGLGGYNYFEAQLPIALEAITRKNCTECYEFNIIDDGKPIRLDLCITIRQIIADIKNSVGAGMISTKFHNTIAAALLELARIVRERTGLETVALSGGVFCNRFLANSLIKSLKESDFNVLFNREVPANDGGIALGQAAIAANVIYKERKDVSGCTSKNN